MVKYMQIGNVKIKNRVFLAPMAGITDLTFRRICRSWGAGMTYSEMVSAKGLYYGDKKTAELLARDEDEKPFAAQIFGSDPDIIAEAVPKALSSGADILDINMGCPAPKIVNNGDGSALMKNPQLAAEIVRAAVKSAKDVPVTVKFRSGWNDASKNALEFAKLMQEAGAAAVTVHPRTKEMYYSGKADRSIIREIKQALSIPVIGSGDLFCTEDVLSMFNETGCDAVMIARGAQGNPFIFRQTRELLLSGEVRFIPSARQRLEAALYHLRLLCSIKEEQRAVKETRKHMAWYIKGIPGAGALRSDIFRAQSLEDAERLLLTAIKVADD